MKILVAEDDASTGKLVAFILGRCGHDVELHWDGEAVLRSLDKATPDLVIMDVELPHVDGLRILSYLRAQPLTRDVPTMMLTGTSDRTLVERCKALGVVDFIVKPFKPTMLRERVRRVERMQA